MEKSSKIVLAFSAVVLIAFAVLFFGETDLFKNRFFNRNSNQASSTPSVSKGIIIDTPLNKEMNIMLGDKFEISGSNGLNVTAIELEVKNSRSEQKIFTLSDFQPEAGKWGFEFNDKNNFLTEGKNIITIVAFKKDNTSQKEEIVVIAENPAEAIKSEVIKVKWDSKLVKQPKECPGGYCESDYYTAGIVEDGEYRDAIVYLEAFYGMGTFFSHYIIKNDKKINLEENNIKIEGLFDFPDNIVSFDKKYNLAKGYVAFELFSELKLGKLLFKDDKLGNIYDSGDGCAIAELPDHTAISYNIEILFDPKKIVFLNGGTNNEDYSYRNERPVCGYACRGLTYLDEAILPPDTRLKIAGTADNGDMIYEIKDSSDEALKSFYDSYIGGFSGEQVKPADSEKRTYEEFLKLHPYLYWKDPFGKWVQFTNKRFVSIPQAEMCKPVIYLYPEEKIKLNVEVSPNGGFTYTNPPYGEGWSVEADPSGQITDLKTGKNYDYLYWEGMGLNYPVKDEGWVIKKEKLGEFFDKKLPILGLNEKEKTDFKNYWLGRLNVMPYYQISFLSMDEFNYLAPIKFAPVAPQTLIRVMMEAKGLKVSKIISEPQIPKTPARNGFTAVEWGGMIIN